MFSLFPGFLKTGTKGSAQGNFGLMDLVAGLHWLRENLPAFGGDPERVTLMGHGTGAALVNFIAVSPVAKGKTFGLANTFISHNLTLDGKGYMVFYCANMKL